MSQIKRPALDVLHAYLQGNVLPLPDNVVQDTCVLCGVQKHGNWA